ncbi:MAG TPA: sigma-70 family RNA polymerase sigma factor [Phycisphaerae bacterium]|nr:sigma-70 family RNA polymerase sigma factor [Phycisphaerae bacterium]HRW55470.1 sigma-70 family RNA polymerase sigma factor [Phycisphaerae bacterium]
MPSDANHQRPRQGLAGGDAEARPDFERYMPRVFEWAHRLTRDRDASMDIVQDVFLKWRRQCETAAPEKPEAWHRTVTARRVFELSRSPRLRLVGNADTRETPATEAQPLARPDLEALRDDVFAALSRLTDAQRDVVLAKVMDDRTFASIANGFEMSISTAKTHFLRGLRTLRESLAPRWKDE